MDKYVSHDLQSMLCKELEDIAKKKEIGTPATLEVLDDLTSSLKNLMKIDKLEMERDEPMEMGGYSQRAKGRYFVDGTYGGGYEPWDYSYAQGGRGNMGGKDYGYDSGNSYRYPRIYPMYMDEPGYSRHSRSEDMRMELRKIKDNTTDEQVKQSISEILNNMK